MVWTLHNGHRRRECSVQLLPHGLQLHLALNGETALLQPDLAYNLGNLCRRVALPKRIDSWSLTSLQQRLHEHYERCQAWLKSK